MDPAEQSEKSALKKKGIARGKSKSVDIYAVQCERCMKWRKIKSQELYEEIRSKLHIQPFVCEKNEGTSCRIAGDLNYDSSRTWVIDKPGLPRTPKGFKRTLVLRKDHSKMDAYYITPTGKKLRTRNEIAEFIVANPEFKYVSLGDFNFTVPKVVEETIRARTSERGETSNNPPKELQLMK